MTIKRAMPGVGPATFDPAYDEASWHGLMHHADVELYKVKDNGRDQYRIDGDTAAALLA